MLVECKLKNEVVGEACKIAFNGLIEGHCANSKQAGEVAIEHDALTTDRVDGREIGRVVGCGHGLFSILSRGIEWGNTGPCALEMRQVDVRVNCEL